LSSFIYTNLTQPITNFDATFQNVETVSQNATSPTALDRAWIIFHYSGHTAYGFVMTVSGWSLQRISNLGQTGGGTSSSIVTCSGSCTDYALGSTHTVRVTMSGAVITVYVDGTQVVSYTDSSPLTSGALGLLSQHATATFGDVLMPTASYTLHREDDSKTVTAYPLFAYPNPTGIQHTIDQVYFAAHLPSPAPSSSPELVCSTPTTADAVRLLYFCPGSVAQPSPTAH
jgi:hypothetical protein